MATPLTPGLPFNPGAGISKPSGGATLGEQLQAKKMPLPQIAPASQPAIPDVKTVLADPKFQALSAEAQGQVLAQLDPKFSALSDEAKQTVLGHLGTQAKSSSPLDALSQATSLSADTRGPFRKAWDEIKSGLTAAQPGGGLTQQPTALGNAAEFAGMAGSVGASLMGPTEGAAGAGAIARAIPSTERAGQNFKQLQAAIGNHSVAMTDRLSNALADIKDAVDTGSTLPPVINKFVTRIADLDEGPLTYKEARQFYKNISDLSVSEKLAAKGNDLRLIREFKSALGETIASTADDAGRLGQYLSAMREYSRAKGMQETASTIYEAAKKAAVPAVVGGGALELIKNLMSKDR